MWLNFSHLKKPNYFRGFFLSPLDSMHFFNVLVLFNCRHRCRFSQLSRSHKRRFIFLFQNDFCVLNSEISNQLVLPMFLGSNHYLKKWDVKLEISTFGQQQAFHIFRKFTNILENSMSTQGFIKLAFQKARKSPLELLTLIENVPF